MKVRLNLATSPVETHRRFIAGAALAGTVAVAALAGLSLNVYRTWRGNRAERGEIARIEKQMDQFRRERRDLAGFFDSPQTRKVMDRAAFVNSLIDQRSFPWTKIFMDLERTLPEGVRVVSIAPKMEKGRVEVTLVIGATSDAAKLKFLEALGQSPAFSGIELKAETRANRTAEADQVQLELVTWYVST